MAFWMLAPPLKSPRPGQPAGCGRPSGNCLVGLQPGTGPESADIIPKLAPLPGELVVTSHVYDKFLDTPLDLALRGRGVTHPLIIGVTPDICVNYTVLAAANRDHRITVVTDAVATLDPAIQTACFDIGRRKFARLRTAAQILAELPAGWRSHDPTAHLRVHDRWR